MALSPELAAQFGLVIDEEDEQKPIATPATGKPSDEEFFASFMEEQNTPVSTPKVKPPTIAPVEEQTKIGRGVESIREGFREGFAALGGDKYGRGTADDLERTPQSWPARAATFGAELIRGAGEAVGDVISDVDSSIGSPLENSMKAMSENLSESPIYNNVGLEKAMEDLETEFPEAHDTIADVGVVLSAAVPYSRAAKMKAGTKWQNARKNRKQKLREKDIASRLQPDDIYGIPGDVDEKGFMKTDTYSPDARRQVMYDDVDTIEGLNPRESPGNNWNAIDDEVGTLRTHLDRRLKYADYSPTSELKSAVEQSIIAIEDLPVMKGSTAGKAAQAVYDQVEKIINKYEVNGGIKPGAMLDARRELDSWLKLNDSKVFEGQSLSGTTLAVQAVRKAINKQVAKVAPEADVIEALRKQSSLLTARDELLVKANRQGRNRLSRALQRTQEEYGLAMPHSSAAIGANTELVPLLIGGGLTGATHGGRGLSNLGSYTGAGLTKTLQEIYNPTRGLLPSALLQDDEENR
jgi:hypothetical protein